MTNIPADDVSRTLTVADPNGVGVPHISVAGGTSTILVSGAQTAGCYCLVDMLVPDGGGPPAHRHDFEEMFTLLEGELEFTFRGQSQTVRAGSTVNVPSNAPHAFKNVSGEKPACCAYVRPRDRTNSSWRWAFPSKAGRHHRPGRPQNSRPRRAN